MVGNIPTRHLGQVYRSIAIDFNKSNINGILEEEMCVLILF